MAKVYLATQEDIEDFISGEPGSSSVIIPESYTRAELEQKFGEIDSRIKTKQAITIPTSSWIASTEFEDFGYEAIIPVSGMTDSYFAEVVLSPTDAISGIFAPVSKTVDGTVTIYASETPSDDITVLSIVGIKGGIS